jgi:hypothetical protein
MLPGSDAMSPSPSLRSPSHDVSSPGTQSPPTSRNDLFEPGSDYSNLPHKAPPTRKASPADTSGINLFREVRSALEQWISALGPIDNWPRVFREKYDEVCLDMAAQTTKDTINIFLRQVGDHVWIVKDITTGLDRCAALTLPKAQGAEADWLLAGDMMQTVHCGDMSTVPLRLGDQQQKH